MDPSYEAELLKFLGRQVKPVTADELRRVPITDNPTFTQARSGKDDMQIEQFVANLFRALTPAPRKGFIGPVRTKLSRGVLIGMKAIRRR